MPAPPNHTDGPEPRPAAGTGTGRDNAALLLVESLIHGLIARSVLSVRDSIEIIEIAADVERELATVPISGTVLPFRPSLLMPIADSLRLDLKD